MMTYDQYISNPVGAGTAVLSYRTVYEQLYHDKWSKIMVRENGKVDYTLYKSKNSYYAYIKIPSEVVENFYYDVVIKLTPKDKHDRNLNNAEVRFFSNDPSFNYSFAHAFKVHDMHVQELEPKMSKRSLKEVAKEKNPQNTIGYVKSLYFAYIVMKEKGLFHVVKFESEAKPFDKNILLKMITNTEDKIQERIEGEEKQRLNKIKEKNKEVQRTSMIHPEVKNGGMNIKMVKTTPMIGGVKSTKTVKKTKTIGRKR